MQHNLVTRISAFVPKALFWGVIVFLSLLLSHNAILYFTHGGEYGILPEKAEAQKDWIWQLSFFVHLPAGIICLLIPWFAFARNLSPLLRRFHALTGKIYTWTTVGIVCPTGIYLALYAKGGVVTQIGFILQGVLLALFTVKAVQAIKAGNLQHHREHIIKSYAVATVVLTFRVLHIAFFFLNVPYLDNYAMSQWLGLTLNLLFAEAFILAKTSFVKSPKTQTI